MNTRTVLLMGDIERDTCLDVTRKLLDLSDESADPITLYLHTGGGETSLADALYDLIRFIPAPVRIVGMGWVASAGVHIFVAPPVERRYCLPNTRFFLHQPSGEFSGVATDMHGEAAQLLKTRDRLAGMIANNTGQPIDRVRKDTERDFWLTAQEAVGYGLAGRIIEHAREID